jgi:hypothetical protein
LIAKLLRAENVLGSDIGSSLGAAWIVA